MKTFKHSFFKDNFAIIDGNIEETDPTEYAYTFSLYVNGAKLFQEEYGKPLMNSLISIAKILSERGIPQEDIDNNIIPSDVVIDMLDSVLDPKLIMALACASYIEVENGMINNNSITIEHFKSSPVYDMILSDFEFIIKLIRMALECSFPTQKKNGKQEIYNRKNG